MHVMHVIDSLRLGGAERMLVDIANSALSDGLRVSVCITRDGREMAAELKPGVTCHVLARRRRFDLPAMRRFARILSAEGVDLLHAHGRSTLSFVAAVKSVGLTAVPVVLHDHFGAIEHDTSVPPWFRLWARRFVTHYVGVYSRLGIWARGCGIAPKRVSVIENALDLERIQKARPLNIRAERGITGDSPIGLVVAGLDPDKGIDLLLEAGARLPEKTRLKLLVAGGERATLYARSCRERCSQLGLDGAVQFLGERSDVPRLIRSVDYALVPSRSESGPLVLIEYLAGGLPVIYSRVGAISHRAASLGVPEPVPPDDPSALAVAMTRLLALSPAERMARGQQGSAVASKCFEIRRSLPEWHRVYGCALEGGRP